MSTNPPDDFDAVRAIVETLTPFEPKDQERIIRWAREKLGLVEAQSPNPLTRTGEIPSVTPQPISGRSTDIRSFIDSKKPQSDNQFAAAVAYYYRFEAPEAERKLSISADDLQDSTRRVGRGRFARPAQTLVNAHGQGYLDKTDRGQYALNTVGENLVAMALPQNSGESSRHLSSKRKKVSKPKSAPATRKKK